MLIAISKYKKPLNEVDAHREAHRAYIKPFFSDGTLLTGGRQNPPYGGVIIAKNATREEFEKILSKDPFTLAELAEYQIIEFNPHFFDSCLSDMFAS